jgi:hypothetical protein
MYNIINPIRRSTKKKEDIFRHYLIFLWKFVIIFLSRFYKATSMLTPFFNFCLHTRV